MPYNETRNKIMLGYSVENLSKHFNVTDELQEIDTIIYIIKFINIKIKL